MNNYHNDQPIKGTKDDPDLLNRSKFAKDISEILIRNPQDDCLTVSLEGLWGYGKTSLINLIKTSLNEQKTDPIVVEYNPWLAGKSDTLIQDFLIQFSTQLNIKSNQDVALNAAKELLTYSNLFSVAKLIPGVEPWASVVETVLSKFGRATKKIAKLKELNLLNKKEQVKSAIQKLDKPIVVIIDDIDRLTPEESFQILRLIKAVAEFPRTSYLLAFDPKYFSTVLAKNNIENAREYLDKIVQMRIPLPIISHLDFEAMVNREFDELKIEEYLDTFEGDRDRVSSLYHHCFKYLVKSPREVKRIFNHLKFTIQRIGGEACIADLLALSTLAIKANDIYENIKKNPLAYIGRTFAQFEIYSKDAKQEIERHKEERDKIMTLYNVHDAFYLKILLGEVFPLLNEMGFSLNRAQDEDKAGRVSSANRLQIAMHYDIPRGDISELEITNFIRGTINREEFIDNVIDKDSEIRFFELMMNRTLEFDQDTEVILMSILKHFLKSPKFITSLESNIGFLAFKPYDNIIWLIEKIFSESKDRFSLINYFIDEKSVYPFVSEMIRIISSQGEQNEEKWVDQGHMEILANQFITTTVDVLNRNIFSNAILENQMFNQMERLSVEKARDYILSLLNTQDGIARIAEIIGYSGSDSINGPYVKIEESKVDKWIDFNKLKDRVMEYLAENRSMSNRVKATLNSILDGKKYYLRNAVCAERN